MQYPYHTHNFFEAKLRINKSKIFLLSNVNFWFSAILELYNPVDFFRESKPICLPQSAPGTESGLVTESYNFHDADIAGWGWTGKEWDPMGRLRAVTTKIWPKHFCEDVIEDAPALFQRNDFWACTCIHAFYGSLIPIPIFQNFSPPAD